MLISCVLRRLHSPRYRLAGVFVAMASLCAPALSFADNRPWNYAVQVTASVDAASNRVTLQWMPPDPQANGGAAPQHIVYRKVVSDLGNPDWGTGTTLPTGQNSYTDSVQPGLAYEYKISRIYPNLDPQFNGVGYIRTGIGLPVVDNRGTIFVVVESSIAGSLGAELSQLTADLVGDGWTVERLDGFSSTSNPTDLHNRLHDEAQRVGNAEAVLLIGHLPIAFSGTATDPDGHFTRPMPADGYYGDVNGDWGPGSFDGNRWVFSKNTFPSGVTLAVGRIDFADLPAVYAASANNSEVALLKNYFAKDHAFRTGERVPQRRAIVGDAFGEYYYQDVVEPFSAEGYRNFPALLGDRVEVYDNYHGAMNSTGWLGALQGGSYLLAFGAGAGGDSGDSVSALGPDGVSASDFARRNLQAEFYFLFGSFMEDWSVPNNLLRSALTGGDYGLASAWAGRPFLYLHAMGMGETLGYAFRLSENASGSLYDTPVVTRPDGNAYAHGVHMALLGDPTLRLDPVPIVTNLSADANSGNVSWSPPPGVAVQEYRVYRLASDNGPLQLEARVPGSARTYTTAQTGSYVIRAVVLQAGSGTYYNASEGVPFAIGATTGPTPAPAPPPPQPDPEPPPVTPAQVPTTGFTGVVNLSSRLHVTAGDPGGVSAGFVINGPAPVQVLIRAVGPSLASFGISDGVVDPQLRVLDHDRAEVARNAGWQNDPTIAGASAGVGAFALKPGSADAAVLVTLNPGLYTTVVQSSHAGSVLLEVYAIHSDSASAPLLNLSTRGNVGSGANVLVGGFTISGSDPRLILIRAVGPGLEAFGVNGTLADPVLTLRNAQGATIAHNDNWETGEKTDVVVGPTPGDIVQANQIAGAFPLASGSRDAALVVQLPPGLYSATVEGANGGTGGALLEIYQLR